ncbi:MAG TPA: hypothetical protein VF160_03125 [Candidatus Dormibacteraeota bacterium]
MTVLGWIGVGLLVLAAVVALVGIILVLPAFVRTRRAGLATRDLALTYRLVAGISALELQLAALERQQLLRPWRRVRRWAFHPLTIALVESWSRRRRRAREARLGAVGVQ